MCSGVCTVHIQSVSCGICCSPRTLGEDQLHAGVNPAGIRSKWPTWKKIIRESNATVWTMQETKCPKNQLKMDDFIIYENVRGKCGGGGVMIAAKKCLNPVLVAEGDEETEAITIEIHPTKIVVSCTICLWSTIRGLI